MGAAFLHFANDGGFVRCLDVEIDMGKIDGHVADGIGQAGAGEACVHGEADFRFIVLLHRGDAGVQPVEAAEDDFGIKQQGAAIVGEGRAVAAAVEKRDLILAFEIGDGVADGGDGAAKLLASGGEAAGFGDGEEDFELVDEVRLHNILKI